MNSVEPSTSFPIASSSGSNENPATEMTTVVSSGVEVEPQAQYSHRMSCDPNLSHDYPGGIRKIVPSDIDVSVILTCSFGLIIMDYMLITQIF